MTTGAKAGSSLLPRHPELVSGSSWPPARTSALQVEAAAPPVKASAPIRSGAWKSAPGADFSSWRPNEIKDLEIGAWHQFLEPECRFEREDAKGQDTDPFPTSRLRAFAPSLEKSSACRPVREVARCKSGGLRSGSALDAETSSA
jgi:hypothetical protein